MNLHLKFTRYSHSTFGLGHSVLGEVLDGSEEVAKAAPWQTVVMVPRSARLRARRALRSQGPGSGRKGEAGQQKVTYLFTEQTASMYVEYSVAKVNRWGKRQERVLGVDREKIYNLLPRLQIDGDDGLEPKSSDFKTSPEKFFTRGLLQRESSAKETKKRFRQIDQVQECALSEIGPTPSMILSYKDGSTYNFEFSEAEDAAEAVARINYLMGLSST